MYVLRLEANIFLLEIAATNFRSSGGIYLVLFCSYRISNVII